MRRRLVLVALAITSMVTFAFLGPLAYYVYTNAEDTAKVKSQQVAQSFSPLITAIKDDPNELDASVGRARADHPTWRISLYYHGFDKPPIGDPVEPDAATQRSQVASKPISSFVPGGYQYVYPTVEGADSPTSVARVFVPRGELRAGVYKIWLTLGLVALALMLAGVAVADRLARSIVVPVKDLAKVTRRLSAGESEARTVPAGPPEIADVGQAVNHLADRIDALLNAEREMMADLSHRLRTPLAALRLNAEAIPDAELSERIMADVASMEFSVSNFIREARAPRRAAEEACDLVDVCRTRTEFWSVLAEEENRPWSVLLPELPIPIPLKRNDLEAAIDAMLGNVFAHTPEGAAVSVVGATDGREITLTVDDFGPGFPEGFVPERGSSGGSSTGLGLDIVKRTAEAAGGGVRVGNHAGGGARVEMWFPLPRATTKKASGRLSSRPSAA
jgi:signal transduction histidine kinase